MGLILRLFAALVLSLICLSVPADEPEFSFLEPLHPVRPGLPLSLQDIESRLAADHDLRGEDEITWAHEGTHYIDSRLSRDPVRAFYCLRGRVARVRHPKISITQVAAAVPLKLRGAIYQQYLVNQRRHWDQQPLYIVHEWLAYTNGSQVRKELGWEKRGETERHMAEMGVYVSVLVSLTETHDPDYNLGPLVTFIRWNVARGREIVGERWNGLPAFVTACELPYAPAIDLMDLVKKE